MLAYRHHLLNIFRNYKVFKTGYKQFKQTGETPKEAFHAMRKLYGLTNGRFNAWMSKRSSGGRKRHNIKETNGVLGRFGQAEINEVVSTMKANGYYVFPQQLKPELVQELLKLAAETPATYLVPNTDASKFKSEWSDGKILVDANDPKSPIYHWERQDLFENDASRSVILDDTFLVLAQEYLGMCPVLDHVGMWQSFPFGGMSKAEAAQMYHYDMDRLKFVKFLIYLTDVEADNGPHCYVKGSQGRKPAELLVDSRKTDEQITHHYGASNQIEILGKAGTVMMVDTSGFHKGKTPDAGTRMMFQLEFADSLFGQNYGYINMTDSLKPKVADALKKYPQSYKAIFKQ